MVKAEVDLQYWSHFHLLFAEYVASHLAIAVEILCHGFAKFKNHSKLKLLLLIVIKMEKHHNCTYKYLTNVGLFGCCINNPCNCGDGLIGAFATVCAAPPTEFDDPTMILPTLFPPE